MTIRELIPVLDARVLCGDDKLDQEVKTCLLYTSDAADE